MILFAVGVAVGIVLSCVVAWFAAKEWRYAFQEEISGLESRINEVQRDKQALLSDCKETTGRLADWKKEAEVCCERRESLIRELKILLENNQ